MASSRILRHDNGHNPLFEHLDPAVDTIDVDILGCVDTIDVDILSCVDIWSPGVHPGRPVVPAVPAVADHAHHHGPGGRHHDQTGPGVALQSTVRSIGLLSFDIVI